MILVPCMACFTVVRLMDLDESTDALVGTLSDFWPSKYTCVACDTACTAIMETEADPEAIAKMKVRDLTGPEFFAALMGLGTPDEQSCDFSTVRDLFTQHRVVKVQGFGLTGTTRSILEQFELEDGTKIYLGAGARGAVVYRITRLISYTQKALDHVE